jgi:hypothetical protein
MKKTLLAALATAATAITLSSGAAFADTTNSTWRPHGSAGPKVYRYNKPHRHVHVAPQRVYRPSPVEISAAHLREQRRDAFADGRVTFIEKIKLNAAQRRHERLERAYD